MAEAEIRERLGALDAKVTAAHSRLDRVEENISEDLKSIKDELHELNAHMNKSKGWGAAMLFLASILGAGLVKLAAFLTGG
jgi:hypothetical protein